MTEHGSTPDAPTAEAVESIVAWRDGRSADPPSTTSAPMHIGRCRLKRIIASGGMGTVYEAEQDEPRRAVAVKVMKIGTATPSALERFRREAQLLARLRHPGIAQVFEAGTFHDGLGEAPYFVMEYIPSALPITQYIRQQQLDTTEKLKLFTQVCDAVHHGHTRGVVHRDLKPSNILVDAGGQVKIIDFGVGRAIDPDVAAPTVHTDVGQLLGTLQYMSPEQAKADPDDIDFRSDVYSLGVVLYQLLTDRLPYQTRESVFDALQMIRTATPPRLSTMNRHLRGDLETIVGKALEKDRERRYQTAEELQRDIRHYLNDEPIVARAPTISYVVRTRSRALMVRHPYLFLAGCVAIAALAAEFIGVPLVYRWTNINERVVHALSNSLPAPLSDDPFKHVVIVGIDEASFAAATEIADALGIDPPTRDAPQPLRALYGKLMTQLADTSIKAVVFDLKFTTSTDHDATMAEGIQALGAKNVDVVIGVPHWPLEDSPVVPIAESIRPMVRWGGVTGQFNQVIWQADLAVQRQVLPPLPSLSLAALGAVLEPGHDLLINFDYPNTQLLLRHYRLDPGDPRQRLSTDQTNAVSVTTLDTFVPHDEDAPDTGLLPGDVVASLQVALRSDAAFAASSVKLEDVLRMDADSLHRHFDGKVAMFGYTDNPGDLPIAPDGRELPGVYSHALALEALLSGDAPPRVERLTFARIGVVISALVGGLIAFWCFRRLPLGIAMLLIAVSAWVILSIVAFRHLSFIVNPAVPLIALTLGFALMFLVMHIRSIRPAIDT